MWSLVLVWSFGHCSFLCGYMYALTQAHPHKVLHSSNVCLPFQMSMPTLKEHIYTSRSVVAEAQHNVMHALFVVLCSKTACTRKDLQKGLRIFNHLLEKHFNSNLEVRRASVDSHTLHHTCCFPKVYLNCPSSRGDLLYRIHGLVSAYAYFQNCKEICA